MKRLTTDNVFEMDMTELALNQAYIADGRAWYRNGPDDELSVCDLIRNAAETLDVELSIFSDNELSSLLADWLQYGAKEPEGVLAILYRALWAMAELREKLCRYEDTGLEPEEILSPVEMAGMACALQKLKRYEALGTIEELAALARQEPSPPLTLEELREMDGEPVWVVTLASSHAPTGWMLVVREWSCCKSSTGGVAFFDRYGEWWQAYRRKPEEGTK